MKVIYNKLLPVQGFTAINLFGLVFARKEERPLDAVLIRHELIHTLQMVECAAVSLVIVIPLVILGFTLWLFLIPLVAFYVLYLLGYLLRLIIFRSRSRAYRQISFEREAYSFQAKSHRRLLGWLYFVK